jgi:hypothetical protein
MPGSKYFWVTMQDYKAYNTLEPNVAAYGPKATVSNQEKDSISLHSFLRRTPKGL